MRILICTIDMRHLTGTSVVARDLALNLRRRGHDVVVYSPQIGPSGQALAERGIKVVNKIERIAQPDIIHGHHSLPTIAALARFVSTPAVWIGHGRNDWFDAPPRFDRIYKYLPVDTVRRDLLTGRHGIAKERIEVLPNAVDLARIPPRSEPLPAQPGDVLVVAKSAADIPTLAVSCSHLGLKLKAIGIGVGRPTATPEKYMRAAHIVFATGRCALEAIVAGAAVVVGDGRGVAGMATPENWAALRTVNFGTSALIKPITTETIAAQIRLYDPAAAAAVSARARVEADLEKTIDRLEQLYREAIAANGAQGWSTRDAGALDDTLANWPVPGKAAAAWDSVRQELAGLAERNRATRASG